MPWTHRSKSTSRRGGGTSAWNTAGQTASLSRACAQYGLTEHQVTSADPPIPCQWRSCHGNPYAVVKLSDMAALKRRIAAKAEEDKKADLIAELGQEGYEKKLADEKAEKEAAAAAIKAKHEKDAKVKELVVKLEAAMAAASNGVADTLEGLTISKTNAKKEWYCQPHEIDRLSPLDPGKKTSKYALSDVIGMAHRRNVHWKDQPIGKRIAPYPERMKQYARFLFDEFGLQCQAVDDDIVQLAHDTARDKLEQAVKAKTDAVAKAQTDLDAEQNRLDAFNDMAGGMLKKAAATEGGGGKAVSKKTAAAAAAKGGSTTNNQKENTENDSKPRAKKARTG